MGFFLKPYFSWMFLSHFVRAFYIYLLSALISCANAFSKSRLHSIFGLFHNNFTLSCQGFLLPHLDRVPQWKMSLGALKSLLQGFHPLGCLSLNFFWERFLTCMYFLVVNYIMVGRWARGGVFSAFSDTEFEKPVACIAGQSIVMIF